MSGTVLVRGVGTAAARPDRAVLVFSLGHTAPTSSEALQNVAERTAALEAMLRRRGLGENEWTSTGVTVNPAYEWRKDQHVLLGQRATNQIQATTSEPALVGVLLTDAVDVAGARVGGPTWVVESSNPAHAEACRLAAADARRRAEAYASGLGLSLGPVVAVDETPPEFSRPHGRAMMAMADAGGDDESTPIEVHVGQLDVTAEVRITFSVLVPEG